ncbi:MAG: helix-hairpin-helix domain-containing protein [Paludibacteraceae bacterium]|nr:helix-hairpin-helix domain-containing protein [Paludibacteraceae bacterium]
MKHRLRIIFLVLCTSALDTSSALGQTLDEIILDIYNAVTEIGTVDYEQLQTDLYAIHDAPIDLNHTSDEELSQLYFLSPRQIDDILTYADKHPFESLYELRLIPSLADYEIRDLLPFVTITNNQSPITNDNNNIMYAREVFAHAKHEFITRIDARKIESFEGTDPVYVQARYRFDYQRRVTFGAQLRRPAGGTAQDLQYGAYLQLRDIGHLHSLVAGNYQASFGQGLVFAPVFHSGKSAYVASVGQTREGLRSYSSVDGEGLHGVGATLRWNWGKATRLDVSALYSMTRANDSIWRHVLGTNLTFRHKRLEAQFTFAQMLWSDSIHPYSNAQYNQHYFRGYHQAVLGAAVRYNYGWFDAFAEVATAQNYQLSTFNSPTSFNYQLSTINSKNPHWGVGLIAGSRFYPTDGLSLVALYRYYSPYFDNALGYAFSETSRLGDENGGYLGFEVTRLRNWRFSGYADVFYFSGVKYGIPQAGTIGYDVLGEVRYNHQSKINNNQSPITNHQWWLSLRARARKKGTTSTYSARAQFDWSNGPWSLRTTADANISVQPSAVSSQPYGVSLAQDIAFDCTPYTVHHTPLSLRIRLQAFDARNWDNRIYLYEHDVLYAFSIPATYGLGGRAYMCLKWQAHPQVALYFRLSETIYERNWYIAKYPAWQTPEHQSTIPTRTDLHVLMRATF